MKYLWGFYLETIYFSLLEFLNCLEPNPACHDH